MTKVEELGQPATRATDTFFRVYVRSPDKDGPPLLGYFPILPLPDMTRFPRSLLFRGSKFIGGVKETPLRSHETKKHVEGRATRFLPVESGRAQGLSMRRSGYCRTGCTAFPTAPNGVGV